LPLRGAPLDVAVGPSGSGQRPDPVEADVAFPAALHQHRSPPRQARSAGSATAWQSVGSPPSPQGTPEALPYPILRRLSSISDSRAAPRCGRRKSRGQGVAAGATVALLLARSLAADWVAHRLGRRVHEIKAGSSAKAGAVWPVCGSSP